MSLQIIKQGLLDTMQDGGRFGHQHLGIGPSGAMDLLAARLANILVHNEMHEAVIEMHFPAPSFRMQKTCLCVLTGADFGGMLDEQPIALYAPFIAHADSILSFTKYKTGARCYLAIQGGYAIEEWLNSQSTHLKVNAGGFHGRSLQKNDTLSFKTKQPTTLSIDAQIIQALKNWVTEKYANKKIEITIGQAFANLNEDAKVKLRNGEFAISSQSDRMGFRLIGETIPIAQQTEMLSTAVTRGTIQLLPSGQLIVLMADHQTTGGYPIVAHVASAAIHRFAQKKINENLCFEIITLENAQQLYLQQEKEMLEWAEKLKIHYKKFW